MIAADRHVISQTTCWERKSSFEMSRRIEITVPNHDGWNSVVREILSKEEGGCNFSDKSARPHMMVESACGDKTMFFITVPGAAVTGILEVLRQNGVGEFVGRVLLSPVEYVKPTLDMPLFVEAKKRKAPVKKLQVSELLACLFLPNDLKMKCIFCFRVWHTSNLRGRQLRSSIWKYQQTPPCASTHT